MEPATLHVALVAIHFMILFTAFTAFQNIVTKIHQDQGDSSLGPFTFAVNYLAFMMSNLFVSKTKYSQKWLITFSTLPYAINYSTGFFMQGTPIYVKYILAALGATVNGIGSSFLWTNVGAYIHKVCHHFGKLPEKGHFYGLFNTIYCFSSVLGSIVVTFALSQFPPKIYFVIVTSIALIAFLYGIFFIKDIPKVSSHSSSSTPIENEETEQDLQEPVSQSIFSQAKQSAKSTLSFYPIMLYTLPLIFIDGINIGVTTNTMLHLMPSVPDRKQNNFNAGTCLFFYGIGCTIGGYFGGKISDKLRIKLSSTISLFFYMWAIVFSLVSEYWKGLWMARVCCFFWGLAMYTLSANLMVICSRIYGGRPESFALTKQFHCLSFVIYEIVALSTKNSLPVHYIMFVLMIMVGPAMWGIQKSKRQNKQQIYQQNQGSVVINSLIDSEYS